MCTWQDLRVCLGTEIFVKFTWWTYYGYWYIQYDLSYLKWFRLLYELRNIKLEGMVDKLKL